VAGSIRISGRLEPGRLAAGQSRSPRTLDLSALHSDQTPTLQSFHPPCDLGAPTSNRADRATWPNLYLTFFSYVSGVGVVGGVMADGPLGQLGIEYREAAHQTVSQCGQVCFPVGIRCRKPEF
jgi:hypothetical protein